LSRVKSLDGPRVRGISPIGKEKVLVSSLLGHVIECKVFV